MKKLIELETKRNMLNQVIAISRHKTFTAQEMLSSIENEDEIGKHFIRIYQMRESYKPEALSERIQDSQTITQLKSNLLLIRPDKDSSLLNLPHLPPAYVTQFSHPASDVVASIANAIGNWKVRDLDGDNATQSNVSSALQSQDESERIDLVLHYGHGGSAVVFGQNNGGRENAIDSGNVALLKGKALSTVSCLSASILGGMAKVNGAKAYLGYWNAIKEPGQTQLTAKFIEAANAANIELLNGKTFQQAYQKGVDTYDLKYQELVQMATNEPDLMKSIDILIESGFLLWNKYSLTLIGDPNTRFL